MILDDALSGVRDQATSLISLIGKVHPTSPITPFVSSGAFCSPSLMETSHSSLTRERAGDMLGHWREDGRGRKASPLLRGETEDRERKGQLPAMGFALHSNTF